MDGSKMCNNSSSFSVVSHRCSVLSHCLSLDKFVFHVPHTNDDARGRVANAINELLETRDDNILHLFYGTFQWRALVCTRSDATLCDAIIHANCAYKNQSNDHHHRHRIQLNSFTNLSFGKL